MAKDKIIFETENTEYARDPDSMGLINTNVAAFRTYKQKRDRAKQQSSKAEQVHNDVEQVKTDMMEIKDLLHQLIRK